jgi:hypothetical protein
VARRLFHTVVVIGAAAGAGCGGQSQRATGETSEEPLPPVLIHGDGGVVELEDAFWPTECASYAQFRCERYSPLEGCVCDTGAPLGPETCGGAPRFFCDARVCPPGETCDVGNNVDCRCVLDAPLTPEECPGGAGQFECRLTTPRLESCSCDDTRPGTPEACPTTDAFVCDSYSPIRTCSCNSEIVDEATCLASDDYCTYQCVSEIPRFGCDCRCVTPIK